MSKYFLSQHAADAHSIILISTRRSENISTWPEVDVLGPESATRRKSLEISSNERTSQTALVE